MYNDIYNLLNTYAKYMINNEIAIRKNFITTCNQYVNINIQKSKIYKSFNAYKNAVMNTHKVDDLIYLAERAIPSLSNYVSPDTKIVFKYMNRIRYIKETIIIANNMNIPFEIIKKLNSMHDSECILYNEGKLRFNNNYNRNPNNIAFNSILPNIRLMLSKYVDYMSNKETKIRKDIYNVVNIENDYDILIKNYIDIIKKHDIAKELMVQFDNICMKIK